MSIQTSLLIFATALVALPGSTIERPTHEKSARASTADAYEPGEFSAAREQCGDQEFSWSFSSAEATPPDIALDGGEVERRGAGVRM